MMARSHVLLGASLFVALWRHPIPTPLGVVIGAPSLEGALFSRQPAVVVAGVSLLVASLSALGPDIDKRGSKIATAGGIATRLTAWSLEHTLRHRGPLHSLLAVLGVIVVGDALGAGLGVSGLGSIVGFGWAAHLLGDFATRRGVPAFWPLPVQVHPPLRFRTGTWQEALVLSGALAVCAVWASMDVPGLLARV